MNILHLKIMHILEEQIRNWIEEFTFNNKRKPKWDDIRLEDRFSGKILETVMACYLLSINPPPDYDEALVRKPMREKYANFSAYPEWFKRFFEENVSSLIELYLIDKKMAEEDFGYIVEESLDEDTYFSQINDSRVFGKEIEYLVPNVVFYQESSNEAGPIIQMEEAIAKNQIQEFFPGDYFDLYKFLKMNTFIEFDRVQAKEIVDQVRKREQELLKQKNIDQDFLVLNMKILAIMTPTHLKAYLSSEFLDKIINFEKPTFGKILRKRIKETVKDQTKEGSISTAVEVLFKGAGSVSQSILTDGGTTLLAKGAVFSVDILADFLERHEYFKKETQNLAKRIQKEKITLKQAIALDLKEELSPILNKNKYDLKLIFDENNFSIIYKKFMADFKALKPMLSQEVKKQIESITSLEEQDTYLFLYLVEDKEKVQEVVLRL